MSEFFTKVEARLAAHVARAYRTSEQVLRESITAASTADRFDVFLSHSVRDADLVLGVKALLEEHGFSVYVDWIDDPQLDRSRVTPITAAALRERMNQCRAMLWIATDNSSSSKWMPWELGYFDGRHQTRVAILPLTDHASDQFHGQEYLGLYPVVTKRMLGSRRQVLVESATRQHMELREFAMGTGRWSW
jgi:hypothetical protein